MSGHSKWHSIKHKKGAEDAKRGKIFTKHAKLIAIAARGGGDPDMNPSLRTAIENARAENMPRDNIERAIKKGTGESKDGAQMEEVFYEGFGPGGVALYIETLTDKKNRTVTNVKNILNKHGGSMGAAGSVSYLFKRKGLLSIPLENKNAEEIELEAIDAGAEDIKNEGETMEIYTDPQDFMSIKKHLEEKGISVSSGALTYLPQTSVEIQDEEIAQKVLDLISALEEDEDVSTVYSNLS
jgi:YebC/PmpR family DNA-binding regulatory protein